MQTQSLPAAERKDGKTHKYWSLVENRRCADQRVVQRHVLYLGALTPAQELSWEKTARAFDGTASCGGVRVQRRAGDNEAASLEPTRIANLWAENKKLAG